MRAHTHTHTHTSFAKSFSLLLKNEKGSIGGQVKARGWGRVDLSKTLD